MSQTTLPPYTIREATEDDVPAILDIYNDAILTSTAIWIEETLDLEDRRAWFDGLVSRGYPVFVAVPTSPDASSPPILGYTCYGPFHYRPGYRFTAETSLYLHKTARRSGLGTAMLKHLIDHAIKKGNIHTLIGCMAGDNHGSIALHKKFGFTYEGVLKQIGYKFGTWMDCVFMQLMLPGGPGKDIAKE